MGRLVSDEDYILLAMYVLPAQFRVIAATDGRSGLITETK
jgi:hypothetical protein